MIGVNLGEKPIKLGLRNDETSLLKSGLKFHFIKLTVMITVNALEKLPQFLFCLLHECTELCTDASKLQLPSNCFGANQRTVCIHLHWYQPPSVHRRAGYRRCVKLGKSLAA